jgi:hypothetical protein
VVVRAGAGVSGWPSNLDCPRGVWHLDCPTLRSGKADCPTHHYGEFHRAKTLRNLRFPPIETCPRSVQYKL